MIRVKLDIVPPTATAQQKGVSRPPSRYAVESTYKRGGASLIGRANGRA